MRLRSGRIACGGGSPPAAAAAVAAAAAAPPAKRQRRIGGVGGGVNALEEVAAPAAAAEAPSPPALPLSPPPPPPSPPPSLPMEAAEALARADFAIGGQMRTAAQQMLAAQLMREAPERYSPEQAERLEKDAAAAAALLAAKQRSAPAAAAAFETLAGDLRRPLHLVSAGLAADQATALALELRRFLNLQSALGALAHLLSPSDLVEVAWCASRQIACFDRLPAFPRSPARLRAGCSAQPTTNELRQPMTHKPPQNLQNTRRRALMLRPRAYAVVCAHLWSGACGAGASGDALIDHDPRGGRRRRGRPRRGLPAHDQVLQEHVRRRSAGVGVDGGRGRRCGVGGGEQRQTWSNFLQDADREDDHLRRGPAQIPGARRQAGRAGEGRHPAGPAAPE
jgi:hypothetical protein